MNLSSLGGLFVFSILLTRQLGKESLGLYTLFTATLMPFVFLVDFGQSTSLVKTLGNEPNETNDVVRRALVAKLLLSGCTGILILIFTLWLFPVPAERYLFALFSAILLPRAIYLTFEAALRAHEKMLHLAAVTLVWSLLLVAGTSFLTLTGYSFEVIVLFLILVECSKAGLLWLVSRNSLGLRLLAGMHINLQDIQAMLKTALPFFVTGFFGILYYRVDVIMLAWLRDTAAVGEFSAASSFVKMLRVVPSVIVAAFFPAVTSMAENGALAKILTRRTLLLQAGTSVVLAGTIFLLSPQLIDWTYHIPESVTILRIFVWSLVPLALYSTLIYAFFQADKARWCVRIVTSGFFFNIILNYMLIPGMGAKALAVSSVASESFCLLLCSIAFVVLMKNKNVEAAPDAGNKAVPVFTAMG